MKRSLLATAAITLALTAAFGANAQAASADALTPYKGALPAPLTFAKNAGSLEVYKTFPAAGGLVGWLVKDVKADKHLIVYSTKDGEVLLAGMALDKTGKNLTASYAEQYVPVPDYSIALSEFEKQGANVVVGNPKAKAAVTIIFDANCGYCKLMHKLITPAVDAGELRVTYVPVAILGGDSDQKAAGILAAKDPGAALHTAVEGRAETSTDKALLAKVMSNTALMKKHGFNGTPGVLYKGKLKGEETVFVANGVPNITDMFAKMGISGQVDQLKKDPQLSKFLRE